MAYSPWLAVVAVRQTDKRNVADSLAYESNWSKGTERRRTSRSTAKEAGI